MNTRSLLSSMVLVLTLLAWTAGAPMASAQTAEEVVDLNIKAIGGLDAIKAVKSVSRKGTVALSGMIGEMKGTAERIVIPGKKAYSTMETDMFSQKSGYNGTDAWSEDMMQGLRKKLEGSEAEQIIGQTQLNALAAAKLEGAEEVALKKLDDETIDEAEHYVLQVVNEGGTEPKIYVDKKTCLITQMVITTENPQMGGEITIIIKYSDYEEHGGVKLAKTESVDVADGMMEITTTFNETEVNGDVDESIFDMPTSDSPSSETP